MTPDNKRLAFSSHGGRHVRRLFLAIAAASAFISTAAAGGAILDAPQLAERVDRGDFEFRGSGATGSGSYWENHIWRFSANGSVVDNGTAGYIIAQGYSNAVLPSTVGRWTRTGNQICISWQPNNQRFDGCYDVLASTGRQVSLLGPQILRGTLESYGASTDTAAATPERTRRR